MEPLVVGGEAGLCPVVPEKPWVVEPLLMGGLSPLGPLGMGAEAGLILGDPEVPLVMRGLCLAEPLEMGGEAGLCPRAPELVRDGEGVSSEGSPWGTETELRVTRLAVLAGAP